jgi:hypothetical protein
LYPGNGRQNKALRSVHIWVLGSASTSSAMMRGLQKTDGTEVLLGSPTVREHPAYLDGSQGPSGVAEGGRREAGETELGPEM